MDPLAPNPYSIPYKALFGHMDPELLRRSLKVGLFAALATKLCSDANLLGPQELGYLRLMI